MKTVKISNADGISLVAAIDSLAGAKKLANDANKVIEASKEVIRRELKALRGIEVDEMPEGETLIVEANNCGLKIDRRGKDSIDIKGLRAMRPEIAVEFTRRSVASYFEPMN